MGPAEKHESVFQVSRQNTRERWPTIQSTAFWLLEKPSSHLVTVKQRKYKGQPGKLSTRGSYIFEGVQYSAPSVMVICEGNKSMNISESLLDCKVNIEGQTYGKVIPILYINSK